MRFRFTVKFLLSGCLALVLMPALTAARGSSDLDAQAAFDRIKSLAGMWEGKTDEGGPAHLELRTTAAGTVVIETEQPGTGEEMVSMYYVDGDSLIRKHHCSLGNQPEAQLDLKKSTEDALVFTFTGGTNLEPNDMHVRDGVIRTNSDGQLETEWTYYENGKEGGWNGLYLEREK